MFEQHAFARTTAADNSQNIAAIDLQAQPIQHQLSAKLAAQIMDVNDWRGIRHNSTEFRK
jgi:hypothetical protein